MADVQPTTLDPMVLAAAVVIVIGAISAAAVAIIKQLQAIHQMVDGAASKLAAETKTATDEFKETVKALHATVADLQAQRVHDAQIQTAQVTTQPPIVAVAPVAAQVVEQVVEHQVVERQSIGKGEK